MSSKKTLNNTLLSAMFLSLAMLLPLLTGQLTTLGNALCPMHIPVLLCGFICGKWYGFTVGLVSPILRFAMFGMPPLMPMGISMTAELAVYGLIAGILYSVLPKKKPYIYVALICAMLAGRAAWGITRALLYGVGKAPFGISAFVAGAFADAIPGIILQIVLIPLIVIVAEKLSK